MHWGLYVGSVLQAFGPTAVVAALWLYPRPALAVTATAGAFAALLSQILIGCVFLAAAAAAGDGDAATFDAAADRAGGDAVGAVVVGGVLVQSLFRLLLCRGLVKADGVFRLHGQVAHATRFRLVPLGLAAGLGFGALTAALQTGTLLMGAVAVVGTDTAFTYYDAARCPQMAFLYWQAWQAFLGQLLQPMWFALTLVGLAAVVGNGDAGGIGAQPTPGRRRANTGGDDGGDGASSMRSLTPLQRPGDTEPSESSPLRLNVSTAVSRRASTDGVFIARPTSLQRRDGFVCLAAAVVSQAVYALISLTNRGAFDAARLDSVAGRGCATSLAVQAATAAVTAAMLLIVARQDVVSVHAGGRTDRRPE